MRLVPRAVAVQPQLLHGDGGLARREADGGRVERHRQALDEHLAAQRHREPPVLALDDEVGVLALRDRVRQGLVVELDTVRTSATSRKTARSTLCGGSETRLGTLHHFPTFDAFNPFVV